MYASHKTMDTFSNPCVSNKGWSKHVNGWNLSIFEVTWDVQWICEDRHEEEVVARLLEGAFLWVMFAMMTKRFCLESERNIKSMILGK